MSKARGLGVQRSQGPRAQVPKRPRSPRVQGSTGVKVQVSKGLEVQGSSCPRAQGVPGSKGPKGPRIQGTGVQGSNEPRVQRSKGQEGPRVQGSNGQGAKDPRVSSLHIVLSSTLGGPWASASPGFRTANGRTDLSQAVRHSFELVRSHLYFESAKNILAQRS